MNDGGKGCAVLSVPINIFERWIWGLWWGEETGGESEEW